MLDISHNSFSGSISTIFPLLKYANLEVVALHSNQFVDDNIGTSLQKWFQFSPNIQSLTFYENEFIGGTFPSFENEIHLDQLSVLAFHGLDVGGILPNNVFLGNQSKTFSLSVYDNQLSSELPNEFILSNNVTTISLPGNLFHITDKPKWMNSSQFISAKQLYLTDSDFIWSWMVLSLSICCYILVLIKKLYPPSWMKYTNIKLIENFKLIDINLTDWRLMIITTALFVFYPFSCSYYSEFTVLSYFSLFFFQSEHNGIQIMLVLLLITHNVVIHIITFNVTKQLQQSNTNRDSFGMEMTDLNQTLIEKQTQISTPTHIQNKWISFAQFVVWTALFLFSICILLAYILSESLPNDNILGIDSIYHKILSLSISIVVAVNTSIIIPRFASSLLALFQHESSHYKTKIIMILRNCTIIIIPLLCSVILLNDCSRGWSKLWRPCIENVGDFDIVNTVQLSPSYVNRTTGYITLTFSPMQLQVLTPSEICSLSFTNINWNKCIRSFLYKWCNVLITKTIVMFFMPLFIGIYKTVFHKLKEKFYSKQMEIEIELESEYATVTTTLEMVLLFSVFSPLLYPLIIISINSYILFYSYVITKLNWKHRHGTDESSFPFYFLYLAIILQQSLTFVFLQSHKMHYNVLSWLLFCFYMLFDVVSFYKLCRQ